MECFCFCWRINKWTAVSFPERKKRAKCSYTLFRMLFLLCVCGSSEWGTCVPWLYDRWKMYIEIVVLIWYNASFWWISLKLFLLKCVFCVPFLSEFWHRDYRFPRFMVLSFLSVSFADCAFITVEQPLFAPYSTWRPLGVPPKKLRQSIHFGFLLYLYLYLHLS